MEPVFGERAETPRGQVLQVSFLELIEIAVAVKFRTEDTQDVSLDRIRRAHAYARKEWLVPYPFATMKFKLFGGHIMHDFEVAEPGAGHMAFDMEGQWSLPGMVQGVVVAIDFDATDEYAAVWYPYGRDAHVVVDPHYAAGRPTIEGTRIPVKALQERWDAGESISYLAKNYSLKTSVVEEILRLAVA
jgi:uncharacterized protein (DUF433 family)